MSSTYNVELNKSLWFLICIIIVIGRSVLGSIIDFTIHKLSDQENGETMSQKTHPRALLSMGERNLGRDLN